MISRSASVFVFAYVSLLTGCGGNSGAAPSAVPNLRSLSPSSLLVKSGFFNPQNFGVSPQIAATQGYATDGTNNFLFSTQKIVETDSQWKVVYANSAPFSGINITLAHIGDGEVSAGKIYAPLACLTQEGCSPEAAAIGVYSADTAGLPCSSGRI